MRCVPLALTVLSLSIGSPALADHPPGDGTSVKVHALAQQAHADAVPLLEGLDLAAARGATAGETTFIKTVYGYLPYWNDAANVPWESLTHLSYFSVELNSDGSLGGSHSWTTNGADLVALGDSYGVQVTLTATLFDDAGIATLLNSATYRTNAIDNLLAIVDAQGGGGINIDFEFVPSSVKTQFVTFMTDLTTAFHAAIPGSHVSLATPAVDWNGAYDYDQLAENTDGMMIMGYGYHWSAGDPGPLSPIDAGTTWTGQSLSWTIADYMQWGGNQNRHKFILGIPLYGREWTSLDSSVPGETAAGTSGSSVILTACESTFAGGKSWDTDSQTPYRVYQSGGAWQQLFCEDDASYEAKFDLILAEDIGGVMYWAVGYTPAVHSVWDLNDAAFTLPPDPNTPPVASATAPTTAVPGETVWLDGTASYDPDGETLAYQWTAVEGPVVTISNATQAVATVQPEDAGFYRFRLTVSDAVSSDGIDLPITVAEGSGGSGGTGGTGGSGGVTNVSSGSGGGFTEDDFADPPGGGCSATIPGGSGVAWNLLFLFGLGLVCRRLGQ